MRNPHPCVKSRSTLFRLIPGNASCLKVVGVYIAIVRYVKCINPDGDMEMSIVMTKNKKWRRESETPQFL